MAEHGGRRRGAGVKPKNPTGPMIVRAFTLRLDQSQWLDQTPKGQRSILMQRALDWYITQMSGGR